MGYSYDRTAEADTLGYERKRRQKGRLKLERQRRYRKERSRVRRQSEQWRKRNRSRVKRYQKRYQGNPSRFRMKRARFAEGQVAFWDLRQDCPGEVLDIDLDSETIQVVIGGQAEGFDVLDFLERVAFPIEESEGDILAVLDGAYEYGSSG